ncbi:MAG TPA: glycosyltransferase family 4 protein [Phycisphaerae bacterium]|nr:glycosyltransferase family 4 protein [Phycisphaerae bacterium]
MTSTAYVQPKTSVRPALPPDAMERPVRVLHVVPELSSGGMERAMLRLIHRSLLHDRQSPGGSGITHGICVLNDVKDDLREHCPRDIPTWILRAQRRWTRYAGWRQLRNIITAFEPDVVHARSTGAWFDAAASLAGLKRVRLLLSFHGRTTLETPNLRRRMIDRWTTRRADSVLTVSHEAASLLRESLAIPSDKLTTIHNGVDTSLFAPAEDEAEVASIRHCLQVERHANVVICVANLLPIKGLDLLIRSWRQVQMADPLARLLLVGEGPLRGELEELVRVSRCEKFVRFLGLREDVPTLLRAADLFVLPSLYEGCSNATLEAMASGLPVLACDVGGMREIVTHNHTGWLIRPGDHEAFVHTLLGALLDRCVRHRVGTAGRDVAVKRFGVDTWVARHAALYRRLAGLKPVRHGRGEDVRCAE